MVLFSCDHLEIKSKFIWSEAGVSFLLQGKNTSVLWNICWVLWDYWGKILSCWREREVWEGHLSSTWGMWKLNVIFATREPLKSNFFFKFFFINFVIILLPLSLCFFNIQNILKAFFLSSIWSKDFWICLSWNFSESNLIWEIFFWLIFF